MSTPGSTLGEFGRIARLLRPLAASFPGALDLADDAALLQVPDGHELVVTTDALVASVHFFESDAPADIAAKLLRVNLSDLAAKGARPLCYSLVLSLPPSADDAWLAAFAAGLAADQERFGLSLLGGDSVSTPGPLTLAVTMFGLVPAGTMVRRAGARPGDDLYVTGTIGDSALALALLQRDERPDPALHARYLRPEPRNALAGWLRENAHAALDVSDGLAADCGHLCRVSGVHATIEAALVPLSDPARALLAAEPGMLPVVLAGGDDYEVLFAAAPGLVLPPEVAVTRIGRIDSGEGVTLLDRHGKEILLARRGWQHP